MNKNTYYLAILFSLILIVFILYKAISENQYRKFDVTGFEEAEKELREKYPADRPLTEDQMEEMKKEFSELMEKKIEKLKKEEANQNLQD